MKTLKDHQATMVSMLASGTAIPTSAIRLAHALHDVLAHLNNTNVAPVAHTERRIDATTPGLNDAMLAQDIAAVKPKQQSLESLLKQRDNTIRQLKGRVGVLLAERDELRELLAFYGVEDLEKARADYLKYNGQAEQAGCRKEDTQVADDGWIEWAGGEQPIADCQQLAIKFRDGTVVTETLSDCWVWSHDGVGDTISARRCLHCGDVK